MTNIAQKEKRTEALVLLPKLVIYHRAREQRFDLRRPIVDRAQYFSGVLPQPRRRLADRRQLAARLNRQADRLHASDCRMVGADHVARLDVQVVHDLSYRNTGPPGTSGRIDLPSIPRRRHRAARRVIVPTRWPARTTNDPRGSTSTSRAARSTLLSSVDEADS